MFFGDGSWDRVKKQKLFLVDSLTEQQIDLVYSFGSFVLYVKGPYVGLR